VEPQELGGRLPAAARAFDLAVAGLTEQQRLGVQSPASAVCILAGAGSGKTSVLTLRVARRIRDGSAEADHTVVCTFTRRAARELRDRLQRYGVPVSTPARKGGAPSPGVRAGTLHQLALTLLRRRALDAGRPPPTVSDERHRLIRDNVGDPALASALATEIGWAKARGLGPDSYADGALRAGRAAVVAPEQVREGYESYQRALDRRRAVDLDDLLALAADALRSDRAFAEGAFWRYRHLSVDEFQDVNPAQFRLIRALAGERNDLCVVGDPNQAIYGWNGADPSLLHRLPGDVAGMEVLRLDENHRSTPQVVRAAAEALGRATVLPPRSAAPDGPMPLVTSYDDDDAEAEGVASLVMDRAGEGRPWSDHAVLARTNEQLSLIGRALARAGIPYRMTAGQEGLAADVADGRTGPPTAGAGEEGTEHRTPGPGETGRAAARAGNAVELATFHRAKGLEWDTVFVVGIEDGFVPIAYAEGQSARAEERRLLYVALTRASRELHCSWARLRRTGTGRRREREPSPWLAAVARVSRPGMGRPAPGHAGRRIAELRSVLGKR
jgi:DNA helicase-2/ATP-dependent DNA helicase PcrA